MSTHDISLVSGGRCESAPSVRFSCVESIRLRDKNQTLRATMPPTSDGIRTVGCSLQKLIPDVGQLDAIRQAVASTHRATILATELLNMHLRRMLTVGETLTCPSFSMPPGFSTHTMR